MPIQVRPASTEGAATSEPWAACADGVTEHNLRALMRGDVPAIRVAGFASRAKCAAFCTAIWEFGSDASRAAATAPMSLLGVNFSNYAATDKAGYFRQVGASYALLETICVAAGFNPLARMHGCLRDAWPCAVEIAEEAGFGRYFAGGIKTRSNSSNLHYDYTPHSAVGFRLADITDQLGWNLYLQMPATSGHTTTYARTVRREGGPCGSGAARAMNLTTDFVAGVPAVTLSPQVGDVYVINTRNPHQVVVDNAGADDLRVQLGSFVGRLPDDSLVLWS